MSNNIIKNIKPFLRKHYLKIIAGIAVIAFGLFFYLRGQQPEQEQVFENPQYRDIEKTLEASGFVDAKRKAQLRYIAGGKITYLGAQEGDRVQKWQTLATIDQRDLQKRLEQNLNLYMKERWDFESEKDNFEEELPTLENRREQDKNQWDLENSVINVEQQSIAISNTVMSAPFSGVLVESPVSVPQTQVLSTDYWELVDPESLIFKAEVDEQDVALLNIDQPASITLDAYENEEFNSKINYISYKSTQGAVGTVFIAEMFLPQRSEGLDKFRLGMNGDALIQLDERSSALTIPLIATRTRGGQTFVDVQAAEGQTEERTIEVGLETDEYVEILDGLTENDRVLIPQAD